MSYPENQSTLIKWLSTLFILWLGLWLLLLIFLPREYYTVLFFLLGIAPILGWFMVQPRRVIWFFMIFFGVNKLDD
ncbi:hypothetical protein [Sedimenticola selenatireducens]|jgi:hypothetical protein|uniref:Uncharacterized protein n=1 Tax=Sedimenticola selenatireducens TaxID=191960 RepID=A0A558DUB0_9GAMM|nr:hypothetical protein [Sedimenticola selenatireducens]TVO77036.1 hypothetical protein FHP88_06330 [Sedimenticola selenatireducens]TVT64478.1 MAG: hypothetical protein FHK78_09575 [Sedimenticola selenatireducens]